MAAHNTPRGVIVGVDGSASADAAVRFAAREARMRHVPLTVVHVASLLAFPASTLVWPAGRVPDEVRDLQENESRSIVAAAVALAEDPEGGGAPEVRSEHRHGGVVPTLVDLSKDVQLVVVGRRGRSGRHRRLLGSMSTGLLHHAHCPVAVVHDDTAGASGASGQPVLVGIDGSRASESAIEIAFDEASWRGVDLEAMHVWSDADLPAVGTLASLEESAVRSASEVLLAEALNGWHERYPEVVVHHRVEFENPTHRLIDAAKWAQLVVVGSHGRGGFAGMLLGSVGTAVAEAATVPVIVARER